MKAMIVIILFSVIHTYCMGQHIKCGTHIMHEKVLSENSARAAYLQSMERDIKQWTEARKNTFQKRAQGGGPSLIIPCVVHVLYNTPEQNISDAQIHSQMDVLNQDFRLLNTDRPGTAHTFFPEATDASIEFCLATQDPDGFETSGINRAQTAVTAWNNDSLDFMKNTQHGGADNWDPERYLNIWVYQADSAGGLLGFATFPDGMLFNPWDDGVAIQNGAFGTLGTAVEPYNLGRTTTHEVGHWLFLRHIWGDAVCGDDFVDDTPVHQHANYGCPSEPLNPDTAFCLTDSRGEMFMNYMDYTNDSCMYMFSHGQSVRMWGAISQFRNQIFESPGCQPGKPISVERIIHNKIFHSYPNPFTDRLQVTLMNSGNYEVKVMELNQRIVHSAQMNGTGMFDINLSHLAQGAYLLEIRDTNSGFRQQQKIVKK